MKKMLMTLPLVALMGFTFNAEAQTVTGKQTETVTKETTDATVTNGKQATTERTTSATKTETAGTTAKTPAVTGKKKAGTTTEKRTDPTVDATKTTTSPRPVVERAQTGDRAPAVVTDDSKVTKPAPVNRVDTKNKKDKKKKFKNTPKGKAYGWHRQQSGTSGKR